MVSGIFFNCDYAIFRMCLGSSRYQLLEPCGSMVKTFLTFLLVLLVVRKWALYFAADIFKINIIRTEMEEPRSLDKVQFRYQHGQQKLKTHIGDFSRCDFHSSVSCTNIM